VQVFRQFGRLALARRSRPTWKSLLCPLDLLPDMRANKLPGCLAPLRINGSAVDEDPGHVSEYEQLGGSLLDHKLLYIVAIQILLGREVSCQCVENETLGVCLEIDDKFEHSVLRHPESLSAKQRDTSMLGLIWKMTITTLGSRTWSVLRN
jgi:hypothetical protein